MNNMAWNNHSIGELRMAMNEKLNNLIEVEVGEDIGQMMPDDGDAKWKLGSSIGHLRM